MISIPSIQTSQPRPQAPSVGALPVVLDEADVVLLGVDAERAQRVEVEVLHVVGRRLQEHLVLEVVLEAEGVLAVAAVGRADRRLDVGDAPRLGAEAAQEGGRVERARADLGVVRRRDQAALVGPVAGQPRDHVLEARPRHVGGVYPCPTPGPRGAPDHWRLDRSSRSRVNIRGMQTLSGPPLIETKLRPPDRRHGVVRRPGRPGGAAGRRGGGPPPDGRQRGRRLGQDDAGGRLARRPSGARPAWVALDASDNDPARFWRYLSEALARAGVAPRRPGRRARSRAPTTTREVGPRRAASTRPPDRRGARSSPSTTTTRSPTPAITDSLAFLVAAPARDACAW